MFADTYLRGSEKSDSLCILTHKRLTAGFKTSSEAFVCPGLGLDFLMVPKGHSDIVGAVDRDVIDEGQPVIGSESGKLVGQGFKGFYKGLDGSPPGLLFLNLRPDCFQPGFGLFKPLAQAVETLVVFGLIKGSVGVVINALLHHIGNNQRFFQKLVLFLLQRGGVPKECHHLLGVGDDHSLGG